MRRPRRGEPRSRAVAGRLVLEDGAVFSGTSFGSALPVAGEVVFTTGMVGYPETLTDPSYRGQILTFTYPSLGNYGVPLEAPPHTAPRASAGVEAGADGDELPGRPFESGRIQAAGVVCASYSEDYAHRAAGRSLGDWLAAQGIPGLTGVDTRALTKRIRVRGALLGRIEIDGKPAPAFVDPNARNLVAEVSTTRVERYGRGGLPIVMLDCGRKSNQIRMLVERGVEVRVVPWNHELSGAARDYAGVFLSNGPGDPRLASRAIETVRLLMRRRVPILGICLGHQILALAAGARSYKMKFGHRSHNQPCVEAKSGRCYQTSQNHGFAVDGESLPAGWKSWFANANDGTNEGIRHARGPWRSVQFHPEAAPGPTGTEWVLDEFLAEMR
jgi:carbamoyl-phosphate synthase small subunit